MAIDPHVPLGFVAVLLSTVCVAQTEAENHITSPLDTTYDCHCTPAAHRLELRLDGRYDSNALRNELITGLWQGTFLDRELRQRSAGRSDSGNRGGYLLSGTLDLIWGEKFLGSEETQAHIRVGYHEALGIRYGSDLYHATFFGNSDFENSTAELGDACMERVSYQTIGFGLEDRRSRSYLLLQLVNGRSFSSADIRRADLFTATDGRYLHLDLDGDHARSDTSASPAFSQGIGLALSAEVNTNFKIRRLPSKFTFGVSDLGAVAWNDQSLSVNSDTTILFEGIRVDDVLELDQVIIGADDLQDSVGLGYAQRALLKPLPVRCYLGLKVYAPHNMTYELQAEVRNLPGYLPYASMSASHFFAEKNSLRLEVNAGGFGGWRVGLGYQRTLTTGLEVMLRTSNALGWVSGHARGRAVMIGVDYAW